MYVQVARLVRCDLIGAAVHAGKEHVVCQFGAGGTCKRPINRGAIHICQCQRHACAHRAPLHRDGTLDVKVSDDGDCFRSVVSE